MRLFQHGLEEASRIGGLALGDRFRRTGNEDLSAAASAFRPKVNDPVSRLDDIQVVLNHHDGIPLVAQLVQNLQQLLNIGKVQTGGRFIKDIQRLPGTAFGQLPRQLDALGLAAGERGSRLTKSAILLATT